MGDVVEFRESRSDAFRREGLGYIFLPPGLGVQLRADFLKRHSEELHGVLTVESTLPGLPPHLHEAAHNFSSLSARTSLAKALGERAGNIPWRDVLEQFCVGVMRREREGTPFIDLSLEAEKPRELDQIERVVPWRAPTWLYGEEGSCKGLVATALAACVATGTPFLGLRVREAKVAYLDWEDDHDEMVHRLAIVCRGLGVEVPQFYWRSCKRGGALKNQTNQVSKEFSALGIGFYVIDSVGLASGLGNERGGPEDTAIALFEAMGYIDATPLCIDHVNKADAANKGQPAKAYGSMYKMALCRHAWEIRKDQEDGATEAHIGLYNRKSNRGTRQAPIGIRATWFNDDAVLLQREDVRESPVLAQAGGVTLRIEHALRHGSLTVREIADELDESADKIRASLHQSRKFQKMGDRWGLVQQSA